MILKYYKSSDGRSWAIPKAEYAKRVAEIEAEIERPYNRRCHEMKLVRIVKMEQHFLIQFDDATVIQQRRYARDASDKPMTTQEDLICALCEHSTARFTKDKEK